MKKMSKTKFRVTVYQKQHPSYYNDFIKYKFSQTPLDEWKATKYNKYNKTQEGAIGHAKGLLELPGSVWGGISYKAEIWTKDKKGKYTIKIATIKRIEPIRPPWTTIQYHRR